ncbi:MAG: glycosyltransferase [Prevotella sp.]|nr:glycosyltransferase [Prevotella sp.]
MLTDTLTIIIGSTLLLLAIITPLLSAFFRRPRIESAYDNGERPGFSIVIPVHDNAPELQRNLPALLQQNYEGGSYEVIVVDESSTDDTEEVLKLLKQEYQHLYSTYIPASSHYLSRRKLSLTIGVKAAKYEWVIFTEADCIPEDDTWLATLAAHCTADTDAVCGYTGYEDDAKLFHRFECLQANCHLLGHPYRYEGSNLAIRKQVFMQSNGFLKNLMYLRGEYDFLVNEWERVSVMTVPEGRMRQESPSHKQWANKHLYWMETRRHLRHTFVPRLLWYLDTACLHLNYLLQVAVMAFAAFKQNYILLGVAAFCLLLTMTLRIIFAKRAARDFGEKLPALAVPFLELRVLWSDLRFWVRHRLADKYDFIRK